MDTFLSTFEHQNLKQEDINHLNRSITNNVRNLSQVTIKAGAHLCLLQPYSQ
jgi:hypothetical protein